MKSVLIGFVLGACFLLGIWVIDLVIKGSLVKYFLIGVLLLTLHYISYKLFGNDFLWR